MTQFNRKTVLVTGATGFIGTALCDFLHKNGFKVFGLTRQPTQFCLEKSYIEWIVGDITKPESLLKGFDGIDVIFHLAGYAHAFDEEKAEFNILHEQINYHGTINILNIAKRFGIKQFIYFSSIKACAPSDICVNESWDESPTDAYGIAKRKAEEAVLSICKESDIVPIILRPSLVYGVGVNGNLDAMIKGIQKGYFPTPPPIKNQKSMISLNDLCRVALIASQINNPKQHIFIVTDGVFYSLQQIVQMIRIAMGKKESKLYCPLWIWMGLAKLGDIGQKILKKRLPINTQVIKKLFSNAAYSSQYIKNELQFEPQFTLQDVLPLMIKEKRNV